MTYKTSLRTHACGTLRENNVGEEVSLAGWVNTRRDHGGVIFIDLRDRTGIVQLTFRQESNEEIFSLADKLRDEFVIKISGNVVVRPSEMINTKIPTGTIEIEVKKAEILSTCENLPFEISSETGTNEEIRLKYRFLDLRHQRLQELLKRKDDLITHIRQYMRKNDFMEVQTPILTNSSPEGARDFLVPSRIYPGKFYALPQAPQQFKQLLMVAGFDRYFQIAPCFRDEDPRADRHPGEFYQLDMEMSFVEQEDIFQMIEPLLIELTNNFSDKEIISTPFPRISWLDAINTYGIDKPDLRYELKITDVTENVKNTEFKVFADVLKTGGVIKMLHVAGGAKFSRSEIDGLTEKAKATGANGLAYILIKEGKPVSPITQYLGEEKVNELIKKVDAKDGDALFFGAGDWLKTCVSLGQVRIAAADLLGLKDNKKAAWCYIVDFPMYDFNKEENKIDFSHNPFSMPQGGIKALLEKDPLDILAYQYDFVLNGYEISSGAIRNHDPKTMYKAFEIAGYTREEVDKKFGGMISAFKFGAPPHGGCAPGIDRLMMVLWDMNSIRDIYAFPKNGRAQDVMMNAPSTVSEKQLKELHISITKTKE
jgi:aspartyl-tRNA synthetase